jgi:DnaJ family protein B protein 12
MFEEELTPEELFRQFFGGGGGAFGGGPFGGGGFGGKYTHITI